MAPVIEVKNLTKKYGGLTVVDHVNYAVEEGEIFGLLGHNGAGKTTTILMLLGLIAPTEGTAVVNGVDVIESAAPVQEERRATPRKRRLLREPDGAPEPTVLRGISGCP